MERRGLDSKLERRKIHHEQSVEIRVCGKGIVQTTGDFLRHQGKINMSG